MAAYLVATIDVTDPAGLDEYRSQVVPLIEQYGGRYLSAGVPEAWEGERRPQVAALIEFPSLERAREWYACTEYQPMKALRLRSTQGEVLILDGLPAQ